MDPSNSDFLLRCESNPALYTRCTMLWSITRFDDLGGDEILRATAEAGYDMSGLVAQLERRQ